MNKEDNQTKKEDEIYCPECSKTIKKEAVVCPHCGVQLKPLVIKPEPKAKVTYVQNKDKTIAIILAIFLGFWTWIYTWQKDQWKFWVSLGITLGITIITLGYGGFIGIAFWIWSIIDVSVKPIEFYNNYPK
ncbi:MAG: zinc ribbon domain-containing protein [Actinobacteria bacterium]|nr:zinc ribbon domain-containing protein [Actinomycetota bacterium]